VPPCGSMGHEVAEARGRLYRPRGDGRYDTCRAVRGRPGIACHGAFAQSYVWPWLRGGGPAVTRRSSRRPGMCGGATMPSPKASTTSSWGSTTTCRSAPTSVGYTDRYREV
jgi:hypothetical protein